MQMKTQHTNTTKDSVDEYT